MSGRDSQMSSALSIMRRMPPNKIEQNLSGLINLLPEQTDELLQRVDQPLEEVKMGMLAIFRTNQRTRDTATIPPLHSDAATIMSPRGPLSTFLH